uniref:Uncharacterized protein n=2 Tax=Sus scrofa TaxID=9823 RepID=A0A8D0ICG5_PIG
MAEYTKKVETVYKYRTCYGVSLRKVKKIEMSQYTKSCPFCCKTKKKIPQHLHIAFVIK